MITLKFPFRAISKDNEKRYNASGCAFTSKKFKDFEELIKWTSKRQYSEPPLEVDLNVSMYFEFKTKVHCDMFNLPKSIADALQGICYVNDRQIKCGFLQIWEKQQSDNFSVVIEEMPNE